MKKFNQYKEEGYYIQKSFSGYWRLLRREEDMTSTLIYDDPANSDLFDMTEEEAEEFFAEYLNEEA